MSDEMRVVGALVPREKLTSVAVAAQAAQAKAEIEAAYTIAMHRPRDYDEARQRTLRVCRRPTFAANTSAIYLKPVSKTQSVTGAGIRLAEELVKALGNIRIATHVVAEDDDRSYLSINGTDLETNISYSQDVSVEKTIERRFVREGQEVLGQRVNTKGDTVYIVRPTPDELVTKTNALVSKAVRNVALRLVPADLLEEAMTTILQTRKAEVQSDPELHIKKTCDAFSTIGVSPTQLAEYLGCPVRSASPAQIEELRTIYQSIKQGETSWVSVMGGDEDAAQADGDYEIAETKPSNGKPLTAGRHKVEPKKPEPIPEPEPEFDMDAFVPTADEPEAAPEPPAPEPPAPTTKTRERKLTQAKAAAARAQAMPDQPWLTLAARMDLSRDQLVPAGRILEKVLAGHQPTIEQMMAVVDTIGPRAFCENFKGDALLMQAVEEYIEDLVLGREAQELVEPEPEPEPEPPPEKMWEDENEPAPVENTFDEIKAELTAWRKQYPAPWQEACLDKRLAEPRSLDLDTLTKSGVRDLHKIMVAQLTEQGVL